MKRILTLIILFAGTSLTGQMLSEEYSDNQLLPKSLHALGTGQQNSTVNFNPSQRLDSVYYQTFGFGPNNVFIRDYYEYDSNNNHTVDEVHEWNATTNEWVYERRRTYTYNSNNNYSQTTFDTNYDNQTGDFGYRVINYYTYVNGLLSEVLATLFSSFTTNYENERKLIYTYDLNDNVQEILILNWDMNYNQWDSLQKQIFTYNATNQVTEQIDFNYTAGVWEFKTKLTNSYQNGLLTESTTSNYINNNWIFDSRELTTYSSAGIIEVEEYQKFYSTWTPVSKLEYVYDSLSSIMERFSYGYDPYLQSWYLQTKEENNYDHSYTSSDLVFPFDEVRFTHQLLTSDVYSYTGPSTSFLGLKSSFFWGPLPNTNTSDVSGIGFIKTYPNPASDVLYFELPNTNQYATIELYNAAGQQLLSKQFSGGTLQLPKQLPAGFYSYLVHQNEKTYSGKVIIE